MTRYYSSPQPITTPPASLLRSWHAGDGTLSDPPPISYTQGALALSYRLPNGLPAEPAAPLLRLAPARQPAAREGGSTPEPPDVQQWSARFLQAVVEVISCDRPLSQLVRWTDAQVYAEIEQRQRLVARSRTAGGQSGRAGRQHVATVHVCRPTHDGAEVSARVITGHRSRAVAARLDLRRGRWLCTALQFG